MKAAYAQANRALGDIVKVSLASLILTAYQCLIILTDALPLISYASPPQVSFLMPLVYMLLMQAVLSSTTDYVKGTFALAHSPAGAHANDSSLEGLGHLPHLAPAGDTQQ